MTREEAIQMLRLYEVNEYGEGELKTWYNGIDKDMREALDMAIEALSQPIVAKHFDIQSGHIYCSPEIAENVKVVVRCKDCMHRHEYECPMYHEEWFTIDEGDGYVDDDYNVIDKTDDDGFCQCGERGNDGKISNT